MRIFRATDSKPFITADDSEIRVIIDRTNSPIERLSLAEATVPAGAETARHHLDGIDEIYYILSGRGLMQVNGESCELGPGDSAWMPAGSSQRIRNIGTEPLVFLCACGPAYDPARDRRE